MFVTLYWKSLNAHHINRLWGSDRMEIICRGIERGWLDEPRVVIYTVKSLGPANLIEWSKSRRRSLEKWPEGADYIAIHDMSNSGMSLQFLLTGNNILIPG